MPWHSYNYSIKIATHSSPVPQSPYALCAQRRDTGGKSAQLGLIPDRLPLPANSLHPIRSESPDMYGHTDIHLPTPAAPCETQFIFGLLLFYTRHSYLFYCLLSCPLSYAFLESDSSRRNFPLHGRARAS